jgi:hypothetical protein
MCVGTPTALPSTSLARHTVILPPAQLAISGRLRPSAVPAQASTKQNRRGGAEKRSPPDAFFRGCLLKLYVSLKKLHAIKPHGSMSCAQKTARAQDWGRWSCPPRENVCDRSELRTVYRA